MFLRKYFFKQETNGGQAKSAQYNQVMRDLLEQITKLDNKLVILNKAYTEIEKQIQQAIVKNDKKQAMTRVTELLGVEKDVGYTKIKRNNLRFLQQKIENVGKERFAEIDTLVPTCSLEMSQLNEEELIKTQDEDSENLGKHIRELGFEKSDIEKLYQKYEDQVNSQKFKDKFLQISYQKV